MGHLLGAIAALFWCASAACYEPAVTEAGAELIIQFEIGSKATYERRYSHPICPACNDTVSGPTWGIGYDAGHQSPDAIVEDWGFHPEVDRMAQASGYRGKEAIPVVERMRDITVAWGDAITVFRGSTMVKYRAIARRTFGPKFDELPPYARDALVSLVYNRGGSKTGRSRREMRMIADDCVPRLDVECIAGNLEAMVWVWQRSKIEAGMKKRRYAEAGLARRSA